MLVQQRVAKIKKIVYNEKTIEIEAEVEGFSFTVRDITYGAFPNPDNLLKVGDYMDVTFSPRHQWNK